jgi:hypothetical protein
MRADGVGVEEQHQPPSGGTKFPLQRSQHLQQWAVTSKSSEHVERAGAQEEFEWDSDVAVVLETKCDVETDYHQGTSFLGFHPYKEKVAYLKFCFHFLCLD